MLDSKTIAILQEQIRRTGRSFLNYVHESFPWMSGNSDRLLVEQLQHMVRHEQEVITALARFLAKQRSGPPYLGAFPMNFTSYNFLEADRLLPLLIEHEVVDVASLEKDLLVVQEEQSRELLDRLMRVKKEHLARLTELRGKTVA